MAGTMSGYRGRVQRGDEFKDFDESMSHMGVEIFTKGNPGKYYGSMKDKELQL